MNHVNIERALFRVSSTLDSWYVANDGRVGCARRRISWDVRDQILFLRWNPCEIIQGFSRCSQLGVWWSGRFISTRQRLSKRCSWYLSDYTRWMQGTFRYFPKSGTTCQTARWPRNRFSPIARPTHNSISNNTIHVRIAWKICLPHLPRWRSFVSWSVLLTNEKFDVVGFNSILYIPSEISTCSAFVCFVNHWEKKRRSLMPASVSFFLLVMDEQNNTTSRYIYKNKNRIEDN